MAGYFSQLSVWNRVLDYTEILQQVFQDPLNVPQSGIVLAWSGYEPNLWTRVITPSTVSPGRTMSIVYQAKLTLKYELLINCLGSHEPDVRSNLQAKVVKLREDWMVECAEGRYSDLNEDPPTCKDCPKNFYQPLKGQVTCLPCLAGKVSENPGTVSGDECFDTCPAGEQLVESVCVKCPRGTYRDGIDMEVCEDCRDGLTTPGEGATSENQCQQTACPPGQMRNATSNQCMDCDYGFYQPEKWEDFCLPCNESYTTENQGSVNASQCRFVCPAGKEDVGGESCQPCQKGYYRTDSLEDRFKMCTKCNDSFTTENTMSTSSDDCRIRICLAGYKRNVADNLCYPCPPGEYQPDDLQTECIACPRNLTTEGEGKDNVTQCVFYCAAGYEVVSLVNETCSPCARGKFKTNDGDAKFQACQDCTTGTTTDDMASVSDDFCNVTACTAGQVVDGSTCRDCEVDTYQSLNLPTSSTGCEPCQPGFGTKFPKQTSSDACLRVCPPGQQVNLTLDECVTCPQGTYNTGNQTDRFSPCQSCVDGYVTVSDGATHPDNCTLRDCPAGQYIDVNDDCQPCPVGQYQDTPRLTSCENCPTNRNTSGTGADEVSDCTISCPAGEEQKDPDSLQDTCAPCDDDEYKPVFGPGTCFPCTGNVTSSASDRVACTVQFCDVGFTQDGSECVACDVGTYKDVRGNGDCTACPTNTTTAGPASTSRDDCSEVFCDLGLYASGGTEPCLSCPLGTYKNETGNQECTPCPTGFTTAGEGSTDGADCSLVVCPAGKYRTTANQCENCGFGKFQSAAGETVCESCDPGFSTDTETSTSGSECKILCDAGSYRASDTECELCAVGSYQTQNQSTATSCMNCDNGFTTANNGSTAASDCYKICLAGQYLPMTSQDTCEPCPLGMYQSMNGSRSCDSCGTDFTTLSTGSDDQLDCQPICAIGEYLNTTQRSCVKCPLGTYNPVAASLDTSIFECESCPEKKTTPVTGAIDATYCNVTDCDRGEKRTAASGGCELCEKGTYQPQKSQSSCFDCPGEKTTLLPGRIFVNACVDVCGDGEEWDVVNQTCVDCPLDYFRKAQLNDTQSCIKCPEGLTTVSTKASACTPKATGGDPTPVQRRTVRIRIRIKIKFCTNSEQMGNAITQFVFNILIRADQRFATLCQGACTNVKITFMAGCLERFQRQRRQAVDNEIQEVEIAVEDVPIEMNGVLENGVPVTQRTEEVVARAFENYQQEQTLLDNNQLEFGGVESIVSVPSCQPGQRTVGDSCEDCAAGTYSIDGAGTSCTPCPMNQYQNESGQTSCQACPEKMYTSGQGSNSSTDCRKRCDEANARQQYCSGHGDCVYDAFTDNGVRCECDDMYTGPTCAIRESPDDQDKMALIGGIVGGVAAFLLILLLIFGIVAAMRRSAKREEKKAKIRDPDQMSEVLYNPSYHYSMYDNSPERPIGGRPAPAIMYMNPAADQDVREFYQSDRDSVRASRYDI
nr:hypothetical protein BaRGS_008589 [Batillaria attramentaria]